MTVPAAEPAGASGRAEPSGQVPPTGQAEPTGRVHSNDQAPPSEEGRPTEQAEPTGRTRPPESVALRSHGVGAGLGLGRGRSLRSWARLILGANAQPRTWREAAYLVTGALVAVPGFALAVLAIVFSALSLLTIGLPFLTAVLWLGRRMNTLYRVHAHAILGWAWSSPPPVRLMRLVGDVPAWKTLAYGLLTFPIRYVATYVTAFSLLTGLGAITYPAWWFVSHTGFSDAFDADNWAGTWLLALEGAAVLLALPWFLRLLVMIDRFLAYALLAPSRDQDRIAALEAGRTALQEDAAALMRRVERDLHDGTQARLVALGVTLSRIEHRVDDPSVRELAKDARSTVTDALAELRDIVRGLHPPALDDGLAVALGTLAGRSAVPVQLSVELATRPPDATASAVYFTVAELLTNVAKHARATRARVDLTEDHGRLRLVVSDDGRGGARPSAPSTGLSGASGTGLSGLSRRVAALDGSLTIDSPAGGPTVVTVTLPTGKAANAE